jgi:L-seryl-tRNA(Ser) seleniumtransferase
MKVNKEEIFGMYAALKSYLGRDHKAEWQEWMDRIKRISKILEKLPTVKSETKINPGPANAFPGMSISWDQTKIKISPKDVAKALDEGTPSIIAGGGDESLNVGVVLLQPKQVDIVAGRIKEILEQNLVKS